MVPGAARWLTRAMRIRSTWFYMLVYNVRASLAQCVYNWYDKDDVPLEKHTVCVDINMSLKE
jgi:hypothetical protein